MEIKIKIFSIKDDLPKHGERVLVFPINSNFRIAQFEINKFQYPLFVDDKEKFVIEKVAYWARVPKRKTFIIKQKDKYGI